MAKRNRMVNANSSFLMREGVGGVMEHLAIVEV